MEENNDSEQSTGSSTAGENGFVHIEPVDPAQMDGGSINQDDGVVVTGVDTVQYEPTDGRSNEDGGTEEFVDCPDDLVSYDGRAAIAENREVEVISRGQSTVGDDIEDIQHRASNSEREIFPQDYEEERRTLMEELSNLHHQLKALNKEDSLIDGNDGDKVMPLHEMINECSKFIDVALNERSQAEGTIRELYDTLHMKGKEIDDLNVKLNEHSYVEATADRILSSLSIALGEEEYSDTSVSAKLSRVEISTSFLLEKYRYFVFEIEMLSQCLAEVKQDSHMQNGMENVFVDVREELLGLKRKELELTHKSSHLEDENGKLMEQLEILNAEIGKLKGEVEQEKTRYSNTKEKLSMAVTKGKALVQQRDSLKQLVAEKTGELERCLVELQEKSSALEAAELRKEELLGIETLANSLQEAISQRDTVLEKCREILSLNELESSDIIESITWLSNERSRLAPLSFEFQKLTDALSSVELPEATEFRDLSAQVMWLLESYNLAKDQSIKLQKIIDSTREAAHAEIDRLTISLLEEAQEKNYLKYEFEDLIYNYEGILEEKKQIMTLLQNASGVSMDDGVDDNFERDSDIAMVINRCFSKIKEQAIASPESSPMDKEVFEKIQNLLYVRDQECKLYEQILEEEKINRLELDNRSSEIVKISEELRALKDEKGSLEIDLQRSEEKASLLREKLSMAVKKGKGLVQERENMKQQMAEKNAQVEALKLDLQQQESTLSDCRDQITKLESDVLRSKEERDQIEQFLVESNTILQQIIEAIDGIILPVDLTEPVEKVKWFATYLSECQVAKEQAEQELGDVKDEASMLASKLTEALRTMKSLEDALSVSKENVSQLAEEKRELEISKTYIEEELQKAKEEFHILRTHAEEAQKEMEETHVSKTQAEQELGYLKEEVSTLNNKLAEALTTLKSREDALSASEKTITQLNEEKGELQIVKSHVEEELHKAKEEAASQTSKLHEVFTSKNSLQEALSLAENNITMAISEKEDAQASKAAAELELQKVKEEVSAHAIKLDEAYKTIKSLEDSMSHLQTNVSQFSHENEKAQDGRTVLESEIKKLKEEVEYHELKVVDASATIRTLEDAVLKAEQDISTLNTQLSACRQELAGKQDNWALELSGFADSLQVLLSDRTLLSLFKQSCEKKCEILKEMDHLLKDMKDNFGSDQLHDYATIEERFQSSTFLPAGFDTDFNIETNNDEFNSVDTKDIGLYFGKLLENLNSRNQVLADKFGSSSMLVDELIASLLKNLEAIRNIVPFMVENTIALQQNVKDLLMDKQILENRVATLEHDHNVLLSACTDATEEMKFQVENNMRKVDSALGLDKLNEGAISDVKAAEELLFAARNVQRINDHYLNMEKNMSTTIAELQGEVEKTRSMYDKAKEEVDMYQNRVFKIETELKASQNMCNEMSSRIEEYRAREDTWNEREAKLSAESTAFIKRHEAENAPLSASQIKSLFDKIQRITIPFPNPVVGDIKPHDSDPVEKLFYIIDNVNELLDQMTLLSHSKEELHSTLSKQVLEIDHLKGEFEEAMKDKQDSEKMKNELLELSTGLEGIIQKLGGDESIGGKKSADVSGLLPVLERLVQGIIVNSENSRSKLLETQTVAEELAGKVKLLEDFNKSRTGSPDVIQERGVFEAPSVSSRSEISEIENQGQVGKIPMPLVPSAAHARTLRKGSNDQLAINIDSESERLVDKEETIEDKGHRFKSLHTTGLVPVQGKMIADRLDGIWVAGGRALMSRPRARLGVIAYWLVLHLWLLATIL